MPSPVARRITTPPAGRSIGRCAVAALLLLGLVLLAGYALVRNYEADDRAVTRTVQRDPMARFVPPGATLTYEILQPSSRLFSTRRMAILNRSFDLPQAKAAGAFAATVRAAGAAGWHIEQRDQSYASGDRPLVGGMTMQIRLSSEVPGAKVTSLSVTIDRTVT